MFPALLTVNRAAVNTGAHYLFESGFSLGVCLGMGLLDRMVTIFSVWGASIHSGCTSLHSKWLCSKCGLS